jgi:hypothetical protein
MKSGNSSTLSLAKRATNELKEFAVVALYLWVCFTAVLYLKASILQAEGIEFAPFGFATIKALICAKFVSVGHMLRAGERFQSLPLIWPTLYKSLVFLVLLLALNALEQIAEGQIHHRTIADSLAEFGGGTLDQLIATSIIGLLILIPFFAFRTLGEVVGADNLFRIFFTRRHSTGGAVRG